MLDSTGHLILIREELNIRTTLEEIDAWRLDNLTRLARLHPDDQQLVLDAIAHRIKQIKRGGLPTPDGSKRPVGRPRTLPLPDPNAPKRRPGRPIGTTTKKAKGRWVGHIKKGKGK